MPGHSCRPNRPPGRQVCHGQSTIRGLRYPVAALLDLLASGMIIEAISEDHPDLERDDLLAALAGQP